MFLMSEVPLYTYIFALEVIGPTRAAWWSLHVGLQGYLAHKKMPPPQDHHRALGRALL